MKYLYKDGFNFGHWFFQFFGNFVSLMEIICCILTLNLVWFDFPLQYTMYSLKNSDKLSEWFNNLFKNDSQRT